MSVTRITLFLLLCTYYQGIASTSNYSISPDTFGEVFNEIAVNHHKAFELDNQGIGVGSVRTYLRGLLEGSFVAQPTAAPTMCIAEDREDGLLINIEGEFTTYHFSYLKFSDGFNRSVEYTEDSFVIPIENGWQFSLLAVYGTNEGIRSKLYIIIIDKDLALCNTECPEESRLEPRADDQTSSLTATDIVLRSFPNPTLDHTQLTLQLEVAQRVTLQLVSTATGRVIAQKLAQQYLSEGLYQYQFDLQWFPAGLYHIVIKAGNQLQSVPIVKLE